MDDTDEQNNKDQRTDDECNQRTGRYPWHSKSETKIISCNFKLNANVLLHNST